MEYKAFLMEQMAQKEERKQQALLKQKQEDERYMQEYNNYKIGSKNQGGGSPIRDANGDVVTMHLPFASQLKNEGAAGY